MLIEHFLITEVNETNVYLVGCLETREGALVDAGGFDLRVVEAAERRGLRVGSILITHDHFDHTGGLAEYRGAFPGCRVLAGHARAGGDDATAVADGDSLAIGRLAVRVLAIPGHTPESVAFHFTRGDASGAPGQAAVPVSVVFPGDVLFAGSVGGTAGQSAHDREVRGIREKLLTLPESTAVYPGHGPATTVGVERRNNPFLT